jgi:glycosyltransferase involved in cell wall biosynthesis
MPRILHLISDLDRSGTQKQLCLLAAGLARAGFDTQVCALAGGGPMVDGLRAAGVETTILEKRWPLDPRVCWTLKCLVDRLRPNVLHTWRCAANAYGLLTTIGSGVRRFVAGYRSMEPVSSSVRFRLDREIGRRSAGLVANSRGVKDFYVDNGLPGEKFEVIPNAVERTSPPTFTRRQMLDELGLPDGSRLIGMVGRLLPHKRIKDAVWAADLLKVIRKDIHLLIFGDGPHAGRLRIFRDQVRIADQVHFLGNRSDVPRFCPHFDLLWSTSAYEGQSNAILEAMAAGVPVVASDIPGTRDLVIPRETGLLVQVGDRAGFAREAHRLLEDPALARRLGDAGRERAQSDFSVEKMVANYTALYRRLM